MITDTDKFLIACESELERFRLIVREDPRGVSYGGQLHLLDASEKLKRMVGCARDALARAKVKKKLHSNLHGTNYGDGVSAQHEETLEICNEALAQLDKIARGDA